MMKDRDLEWLLCEMPALMGETSGHSALVAALERGPGGSASSERAWEAVARARPHAQRARRLLAIWGSLAPDHRELLRTHYTAPASRLPGIAAQLGELASAALLLASDRGRLEAACSHPTAPQHGRLIAAARRAAQSALGRAHRAWVAARDATVLSWAGG
jgi:hypothetical protein